MEPHHDLLDAVVSELKRRSGELPDVARGAGLSYDTVHRIKNRENDPGYSKVAKLARVLEIRATVTVQHADGAGQDRSAVAVRTSSHHAPLPTSGLSPKVGGAT